MPIADRPSTARRPAMPDGLAHALDLMRGLGPVAARRMFGGHGVFLDGLMFAVWLNDALYFKVDDQTVGRFEAEGLPPFRYLAKGQEKALRYHLAPDVVWDDPQHMLAWAGLAQGAALRAAADKAKKANRAGAASRAGVAITEPKAPARARAARPAPEADDLASLPNLGPQSKAMLAQAGLHHLSQLRRLGAVKAYVQVKAVCPKASLNLLWALEGALSGRTWQQVAQDDRATLLMALDDALRGSGQA